MSDATLLDITNIQRPSRLRKAWCELWHGGHKNLVCGAWAGDDRARAIRLVCENCGKQTKWYDVPLLSKTPT